MALNLFPLSPTILLWIFDKLLVLVFIKNRIDTELGLPDELKEITIEKYQELRTRVISFKTSILFEESAQLVLTADEINTLHLEKYIEYSRWTMQYKASDCIIRYDIKDNEFFMKKIYPFLYFKMKPLFCETAIKFSLRGGEVFENHKLITMFNQLIPNDEYSLASYPSASNIIYFILGSESNTLSSYNPTKSQRIQNRQSGDAIVRKLKSIRVRDNRLILEA